MSFIHSFIPVLSHMFLLICIDFVSRVSLKEKSGEKLHSVGYKNIAMNEKHVNAAGDVLLFVR